MKKIKTILVNVCRLLLAVTFIVSGFVKAVDPQGTQLKISDYLDAFNLSIYFPDFVTLLASILLSAIEFGIGMCVLFAIRRHQVSRLLLVIMSIFTFLTLWLAIYNPINDCGCFGDAFQLSNWQTFWKNVLLLASTIVIWKWPVSMMRFISKTNQWIVINYSAVFIIALSGYSLYNIPPLDFRPYYIGADIKKGMEIPKDAPQPQFETTFILEKDGKRKTFTLDNYPDSTWTFIDSKTVQAAEGYIPPIHDFSIVNKNDGNDITTQVLENKGYTFLLISPHLEQADDSHFDLINQIYEYAQDKGYNFYCLTASSDNAMARWRDMTGAEYPFCITDETTLKTIIRSNPGLLLIKDGVIIRKWGHNQLPDEYVMNDRLEKIEIGKMPKTNTLSDILNIISWFIIPLLLLTLADRLWTWTKWLKNKEESNKFINFLKRSKNEKENCSR